MKNTKAIVIGIISVAVLILGGLFIGSHNAIISLEETVDTQYSNIKVQLERRADLIPNLISTVKGYMQHEEKIINDITAARERMTSASNIKEMSEANDQMTSALNALNVVVENYPDLKSSQNFINLQDELAGTENRISTVRQDYNNAVKEYNTKIQTIPTSIVASMMGKKTKDYFEVSDTKKIEVPTVDFSE